LPADGGGKPGAAPTSYIRHYGFALRLDPITSSSPALDRQDATFRISS
jgi:Alpha-L-arabinofuranosidase B (ABFB) domain